MVDERIMENTHFEAAVCNNKLQEDLMQSNEFNDLESYVKWAKDAKKKKLLHKETEIRLVSLKPDLISWIC